MRYLVGSAKHLRPANRTMQKNAASLFFATASIISLLTATSVSAQTVNSGVGLGPSQDAAKPLTTPSQPVAPQVEHALGDLGGARSALESHGIYLMLDAISEFAGNVSGGTRQGATFANQIGFESDIDWEKLANVKGFSTHLIIVNRSGSSDSHLFGDNLEPVQEIYGSGGNTVAHLVSAYAQETMFGRRVDIAAGRMNVENDFASSPLYCNYMNNTLCGDPKAAPGGDVGHSAYPDAAWGARVRFRPTAATYITTGLYEVNQDIYSNNGFRSGFKFSAAGDSGVYLPIEAAYEPQIGADKMPGHYKIGMGYDTSGTYTAWNSALTPNIPAGHKTGNTQFWFLVDQMLMRQGDGDTDGLIALGGFVHNDPTRSSYAEQYILGLLDGDFWKARPKDKIGLLFTYDTVSGPLGKIQAEEQMLGLPISNSATGPQSHEEVLEANYDIHVSSGINFEPDFQYVIHPNAQYSIRNATIFGFKAHVSF